MEDEFFDKFYNKLQEEMDDEDFILKLKTLIENKKLKQPQYQKLIKETCK